MSARPGRDISTRYSALKFSARVSVRWPRHHIIADANEITRKADQMRYAEIIDLDDRVAPNSKRVRPDVNHAAFFEYFD